MRLLWSVLVVAVGCGNGEAGGGADGGGGSAGETCGGATCSAGQLCVAPCQPASCGDAGTGCEAAYCWTPPASCGSAPTCACVQAKDPCFSNGGASLGVCTTVADGKLTCDACD